MDDNDRNWSEDQCGSKHMSSRKIRVNTSSITDAESSRKGNVPAIIANVTEWLKLFPCHGVLSVAGKEIKKGKTGIELSCVY